MEEWLNINEYIIPFLGSGISPASSGSGRGIGGSVTSQIDNASSQSNIPRRPSPSRQPVSQPRQPAAKPRPSAPRARPQPRPVAPQPKPKPVAPKSRPQPRPIASRPKPRPKAPRPQPQPIAPRPQPQPSVPRPQPQPIAPKVPVASPLPETLPIESVPAYVGPSANDFNLALPIQTAAPVAPKQPIAPAVIPTNPEPTYSEIPVRQTPSLTSVSTDSYNDNPVSNTDDFGTGINSDYDNAEEEGYNYRVPPIENQLIIERPKKRKPTVRPSPTPRNDDFLDIEAPLPIYGAPPEPFDGGLGSFSSDILTPPVEEEEEALPGYLPPDPRIGKQSRNGRRGRRFKGFSKRFL